MAYQRKRRPERICKHCGITFKKKCRNDAWYCSTACKLNSDDNIQQLARMRRMQAGKNINKLEKLGYKLLDEMGVAYEPQFIYACRYVADAVVEKNKWLIQFDGDYWHGNTDIFPVLTARQLKQKEVDARGNQAAQDLGYKVLRVWESEFKYIEKIKIRFSQLT